MRKAVLYIRRSRSSVLEVHPVLEHLLPVGGEDALRVELYSADVELPVAQGHDLSLVGDSRHFQAVGQPIG